MIKIKITGCIERIVFQDPESSYTVARFQEEQKKELTTIVGNIIANPGEAMELEGRWIRNKKYGFQFHVDSYRSIIPATIKGIEKYLGSGLIKGIGPELAKRIVTHFKEQTLNIINETPERLAEVEGIGEKRIAKITKAWADQKEIQSIMVFLQSHDISPLYATKIYKQYGAESINVVRYNPYQLAEDIRGIGFITADKIASSLGIQTDSLIRVKEGIIYTLKRLIEEGHVYYPHLDLIQKAAELLKVDEDLISPALQELVEEKRIVIEEDKVYLKWLYVTETNLALRLATLKNSRSSLRRINTQKAIEWVENRLKLRFAPKQKEAIMAAAEDKVLIITGGPGTGKTTIIRAIIEILRQLTPKIVLAAPTGRAAKRMEESTGVKSQTIHRLLEYGPEGFQKGTDDPLDADVVIVDEASMIDISLMYNLAKAIPHHATLILVGDINQLPSVGPGSVLADMIASEEFKTIYLDEIFRQSQQSQIVVNAHQINNGYMPIITNNLQSDFFFFKEENPERAANLIVDLCTNRIPRTFGFKPQDIQVLSPMHKGVVGVGNLNSMLQTALNRNHIEVARGGQVFRLKDRVVQLKNSYDKDVFNGDIGEIVFIDNEEQEVKIKFDDRVVAYDFSELDEITLAYAMSIHKSQGSEFPVVVIPVLTQHYVMLQRNLIYTGITRGKKMVVLVGTKKALAIAIRNNKALRRYSKLEERLRAVEEVII